MCPVLCLCFLAASFPFHISFSFLDVCCCFKISVSLLTQSPCLFSQASFKNVVFLSNLFLSKDLYCLPLLTPRSLLALSKAVSGKGKREPVFQKGEVAFSCQQPCSENVQWFSGRSVGATKETAQLDLASMGLCSSDSATPGEEYYCSGSWRPDRRGCNRKCLGV